MRVSFEDALKGLQTTVPVTLELACHTCHGTGAAPGHRAQAVPALRGQRRRRDLAGAVRPPAAVPELPRDRHGRRDARARPATAAAASGARSATACRSRPGSRTARKIRLKGKGEAGCGGAPAGDLFVVTRVEPSKLYERRGDDLVLEVPVGFDEAALGATIEIPTPDGRVSLKVPAGLAGRQAAARSRGTARPGSRARAAATCSPACASTVPAKLTKAEREALEGYQRASHANPRERLFD